MNDCSLVMSSDGSGDESQSSVVRRENKGIRVNPMIQKVMLEKLHLVGTSGTSLTSILLLFRPKRWREKLCLPAIVKKTTRSLLLTNPHVQQ